MLQGQFNALNEKTEHNLDILKILKHVFLDIYININNFPYYCKGVGQDVKMIFLENRTLLKDDME